LTDATDRLCPSCGHGNPVDAQFCGQCGAILVKGRDAARRTPDPPAPEPWEASRTLGEIEGRSPEPMRPANRTAWLAGGATLVVLLLALAFVAYQRLRANEMIPIPGDVTPTAIPPSEAAPPLPQPTASGMVREAPERPAAPPPEERRRAEQPAPDRREEAHAPAVAPSEPELMPTAEPKVASRELPRPRAEERTERGRPQREPGWYRVRYDRSPLFREPDETGPVITKLRAGTRIRVTQVLRGFLRVESTTGKEPGYLSSDDALPDSVAGQVR